MVRILLARAVCRGRPCKHELHRGMAEGRLGQEGEHPEGHCTGEETCGADKVIYQCRVLG